MMDIHYSPKFLRRVKKLPEDVVRILSEKERIFLENPFNAQLNTHKLHGRDREFWAFSINKSLRVKIAFEVAGGVLFVDVGSHGDVYK